MGVVGQVVMAGSGWAGGDGWEWLAGGDGWEWLGRW